MRAVQNSGIWNSYGCFSAGYGPHTNEAECTDFFGALKRIRARVRRNGCACIEMRSFGHSGRRNERRENMKRRVAGLVMAAVVAAGILSGCGTETGETAKGEDSEVTAEEADADKEGEAQDAAEEESDAADSAAEEDAAVDYDGTLIRVGSLKGPTTMGLVNLMKASDEGTSQGNYEFTMASDPSEIVASVASGDLDIAMIPANLAATLYNKTEGGVSVIDINTLGVLYAVTADESISSIADLAGKTVLTTGQGATPEYALNYLLDANGVTDCTLEFHSEATEIAALLQEDPMQIAVLPQPFVTVAEAQNDQLRTAFSLTDEWDAVTENGSRFLTGVTIVRDAFFEEHEDAVAVFMEEHEQSAESAAADVEGTAELVAEYGILEKAQVAQKALPYCNIVCITGEEMKEALSGYLEVLYQADQTSVGGSLPADDFYLLDVRSVSAQ